MMQSYSKNEAIDRINKLAKTGKAFLFIINYKQDCSFVEQIDNIDPSELLYNLNGFSNCTSVPIPLQSPITWRPTPISLVQYKTSFDIVRRNILGGNSFLTNLTCITPVATNLGLEDIFYHSQALYKLWLKNRFVVFSPEIFIRIENGKICSYPMKGTMDATLPSALEVLMEDEKEAAEHATIVDLIRNDLSMVADCVAVTLSLCRYSPYKSRPYFTDQFGNQWDFAERLCFLFGRYSFQASPCRFHYGSPKT